MKKACICLAVFICFISSLHAQQSCPPGYIGLFTDEDHLNWYVTGTPVYSVEMWIWCLPGNLGQICAEFRICYPDNVIQGPITENESLISVTLGDLATGISLGYTNCQWDWHWCYHQTLWVIDQKPTFCKICPHPETGEYVFANCEEGFPLEPCIKLTDLCINQCWDYVPPSLWEVDVVSSTEIEAVFDRTVTAETAGNTDNYAV